MAINANFAAWVVCHSDFPISISTGHSYDVARPCVDDLEFQSNPGNNVGDMLEKINALHDAKLYGDEVAVRPLAVEAAEGVVFASLMHGYLPAASEIVGDGMGGIEISWREGKREMLLSIAASRPDLPPDIYLMLVDRAESERSKRFRTIRQEIPRSLVEHISWLKTPVVIPTPQS